MGWAHFRGRVASGKRRHRASNEAAPQARTRPGPDGETNRRRLETRSRADAPAGLGPVRSTRKRGACVQHVPRTLRVLIGNAVPPRASQARRWPPVVTAKRRTGRVGSGLPSDYRHRRGTVCRPHGGSVILLEPRTRREILPRALRTSLRSASHALPFSGRAYHGDVSIEADGTLPIEAMPAHPTILYILCFRSTRARSTVTSLHYKPVSDVI